MKRKWTRFRISTLLLLVTVTAGFFGFVISPELERNSAARRLRNVASVSESVFARGRNVSTWQSLRPKLAVGVDAYAWFRTSEVHFRPLSLRPGDISLCTHLGDLIDLNLDANAISDKDVLPLRNVSADYLSLNLTDVTDESLSTFAKMPNLHSLSIGGTAITPTAIDQFRKRHPKISVAHVYWKPEWRAAARKLSAEGFKVRPGRNGQDVYLSVRSRHTLSKQAAQLLAELDEPNIFFSGEWQEVTSVIYAKNLVSADIFDFSKPRVTIKWSAVSPKLERLRFSAPMQYWMNMLTTLNPRTKLRELEFWSHDKQDDGLTDICSALAKHKSLETLAFFDVVPADAIRELQSLPNLQRLEIERGDLSKDHFAAIADLHSLKHLHLACKYDPDDLDELGKSKTLEVVHFDENLPPPSALASAFQSMPQLRVIGHGLSYSSPNPDFVRVFDQLQDAKKIWDKVASAEDSELVKMSGGDKSRLRYLRDLRQLRQSSPRCQIRSAYNLDNAIKAIQQ